MSVEPIARIVLVRTSPLGVVRGQGANVLGVDQTAGQLGLWALIGALLPIIVGMFKKPAT